MQADTIIAIEAPPPNVAQAFAAFPKPVQTELHAVRYLIFECAASTQAIGPITETLKWGQPSYLTEATRAGSTIRLGTASGDPETPCVFFTCHTGLVEDFRRHFPEATCFVGNRAIQLAPQVPPTELLRLCLTRALTYKLHR